MSTPAAVRGVWEKNWMLYRHFWRADFTGNLLQPVLYLLGMGIGVGALVDGSGRAETMLDGATYLAFLGPALMATTAMMTASMESLWPLLGGFRWSEDYLAMRATPLRPADIVSGFALWVATRAFTGAVAVAVVLMMFSDTRSWGLLAAVPSAVLMGVAFAMPIAVWSSTREREVSFPAIMRFGLIPMFLFAGAFFPVEQLPGWSQPLAWITPLYHGVELCRGFVAGTLGLGTALVHAVVLAGYATAGWGGCRYTFRKRLET